MTRMAHLCLSYFMSSIKPDLGRNRRLDLVVIDDKIRLSRGCLLCWLNRFNRQCEVERVGDLLEVGDLLGVAGVGVDVEITDFVLPGLDSL